MSIDPQQQHLAQQYAGFVPAQQGYGHPGYVQPAPAAPGRTGLAVTSLVLGIVAVVLCLVPIVNLFAALLAILGFVFGLVGWLGARKGKRGGRGKALAGTILAAVALVGAIGSSALYAAAVVEASESLNRSFGGATAQVLAEDLTVEFGSYTATESYGIRDGSLTVTVTNKGTERQSFDFKVDAVNADGTRIATDSAYVPDLAPGQSDEITMFDFASQKDIPLLKKASFEVIEASAY
ncbi:MAG: CARDB domain-containing protein [Sporichthyaceae bacterium]